MTTATRQKFNAATESLLEEKPILIDDPLPDNQAVSGEGSSCAVTCQRIRQGRKQFFKQIAAGFGLASAILVGVGLLSYQSMTGLIKTSNQVRHSQAVFDEIEDLLSHVKDAETGQRGYILTGKERYLEPYRTALTEVEQDFQKLRRLTADNPNHQRRIDMLKPLITKKLEELKQTINLRKQKGFAAALQVIQTDQGRYLMDNIRSGIREMELDENQLLTQRSLEQALTVRNTIFIFSSGIFLNSFIIAIVYYLIYREFRQRQRTEAALQQERDFTAAVLNTSSALVVVLDSGGRIVRFNYACEQTTGYWFDEVKGKYFWDLFLTPEEIAPVKASFKAVQFNSFPKQYESYWVARSGVRRLIAWSNTALLTPDGKINYIISTGIDITERKQVELQVNLLQTLMLAISECEDFDSALAVILRTVCETKDWNYGEVWIPCPEDTVLKCSPAWYSRADAKDINSPLLEKFRSLSTQFTFAVGSGLPGRVWFSQQPEWQENVSSEPEKIFLRTQIASECGLKAGLGIPLIVNAQVLAVLVFFKFESCHEDTRLVESIAAVAAQLGVVIQRKQMEQVLRESEERFQAFMNNSPAAAFIKDEEGRYVYVNGMLERSFKIKSTDWLGKTDFDLWPGETAKQLRDNDTAILSANQTRENLEILPAPDGCLRHWLSLKFPCKDISGRRLLGGMAIDITERQQAESELREMTVALENTVEGISRLDSQGHYIAVNTAYASMLGYKPEELIGTQWQLTVHPEDRENMIAAYQYMLSNGKIEATARGVRKDGAVFYKQVMMVCAYDKQQKFIGHYCFMKDITERQQTQAALQEANEKLAGWVNELEERNRDIALLGELSDVLQACFTVEEAYGAIANLMPPLFPQTSGGIFLISSSKNLVEGVAYWGCAPLASQEVFTPYECWALRRGRPHSVDNLHDGLYCQHLHPHLLPAASLCVPMMAQGEALGVLYLSTQELGQLTPTKQQLAVTVAENISLALANLKLRQTLKHQSIRDPLTGLFNRRYMEESLEREMHRCVRNQQPLGIIMLDVDHFKRFNDTFGHDAGDAVLRELGMFLQKHIRRSDIACRYGGEELILILPEAALEIIKQRAEQIREGVKHLNVQHQGQPLGAINLSLGVACFPEHGSTAEAVIRSADAALYCAKKQGRDRVIVAA